MNTYIHYGHKKFDMNKFEKIRNRASANKPFGGLWASDVESEFGWKDWSECNDFNISSLKDFFRFTITPEARILVIDDTKVPVPERKGFPDEPVELMKFLYPILPDFEKISREYDVIDFRYSDGFGLDRKFYTWDCDCVLIMNPNVISIID